MTKSTITRRDMLTMMGIGGASAVFALAGCTAEKPTSENPEPAAAEAAEEMPTEGASPVETEYKEVDIVIVGGGGGGLCAAVAAGDFGAESVLLLEKGRALGGNSLLSHGSITNPDPDEDAKGDMTPGLQAYLDEFIASGPQNESEERYWDEFMAQYKEWQQGDTSKCLHSPLWMSMDFARKDEVSVDEELVLYERQAEWIDWCMPMIGEKLSKGSGGSGYPWPNQTHIEGALRGEKWIEGYQRAIEKNGFPVEIMTSTPATELITDHDGNVLGVMAQKTNGGKLAVYAKRGVILACGGFTANNAMLQQYNVELPYFWIATAMTDGTPNNNGDGILISQAIGATVGGMSRIQNLTQCSAITGSENSLVGDRRRTLLRVGFDGKRFAPEDASRLVMTRAILELPEMAALQISDATNCMCEDGKNQWGVPLQTLVDEGSLYIADSLDELAEQFGADPAVLAETVANFNQYCDDGEDPEFGNTLIAQNCKLTEPPFYAFAIAPAVHITYGGICVDENLMALKYDEKTKINGLYVAGDCRNGAGGVDVAMPDGWQIAKHLMNDIAPTDRTEAIEAAKAAEAEAAKAAADAAAAAASAAGVTYADGNYEGTAAGMGGDITVSVTVQGGKVTVKNIGPNNETVGVGGYEAIEDGTYARLIEEANGAGFDVISGATITSEAIQRAVAQALEGAAS